MKSISIALSVSFRHITLSRLSRACKIFTYRQTFLDVKSDVIGKISFGFDYKDAIDHCRSTSLCRSSDNKMIVVALSGGVDSSVAAALVLQERRQQRIGSCGTDNSRSDEGVIAIHMSNWNSSSQDDDSTDVAEKGGEGRRRGRTASCTNARNWDDAVRVVRSLGLPDRCIERHSFESEYWNYVFEPFLSRLYPSTIGKFVSNSMGNPDTDCNKYIKFGALPKYLSRRFGDQYQLVTGHYARLFQPEIHNDQDRSIVNNDATRSSLLEKLIFDEASTTVSNGSTTCTTASDTFPQSVDENADYSWIWKSWGRLQYPDRPPPLLLSAVDKSKDQSYFLATCSGDSFTNVRFPLGEYYKNKNPALLSPQTGQIPTTIPGTVREVAKYCNLPTATKQDSFGICFVGNRRAGFAKFIQEYLPRPMSSVKFIDIETGVVIEKTDEPTHASLYSVGQGARLAGMTTKYFVVSTCLRTNTVTVCPGTHHPALYVDIIRIRASCMNWIARNERPTPISNTYSTSAVCIGKRTASIYAKTMRAQCRIRHLQPLVDCTIVVCDHDDNGCFLEVHVDKPLRGVSPGQVVVLYVANGLVCLGGGIIECSSPTYWELNKPLPTKLHPSSHNDTSLF